MTFLEKDLETIIFETPNDKLSERGLHIKGKKKRQLRIGNYGISDIITLKRDSDIEQFKDMEGNDVRIVHPVFKIQVFELKQKVIDCNSLMQACRYAKGLEEYLHNFRELHDVCLDFEILLIGKDVQKNGDFVFLLNDQVFPKLNVYTYEYDFDGIRFYHQSGFKRKDSGFINNNEPF